MRRVLPLVVALLAVSCGGSKGPTAPSGPQYPSISGTYQSNALWQLRVTRLSDGAQAGESCSGSITLSQQGGSFSGSFLMGAPCNATSGSIVQGSVRTDGGISFGTHIPGSDPNAFTAQTGCTITSAASLYTGFVTGGTLDATWTATAFCPGIGTVSATMRALGTR